MNKMSVDLNTEGKINIRHVLYVWGNWKIYSLWLSDNIQRHRLGSTLSQVMACCLTALSHYLNQCWLIISEVLRHLSKNNFTEKGLRYLSLIWVWKIANSRFHLQLPGANELKKMTASIVIGPSRATPWNTRSTMICHFYHLPHVGRFP